MNEYDYITDLEPIIIKIEDYFNDLEAGKGDEDVAIDLLTEIKNKLEEIVDENYQ